MKELKDYIHLYLGSDVQIFNTVTNEWGNWRKCTPSDLNLIINHDVKAQISLKRFSDMDAIERGKYEAKFVAGEWGTEFYAEQCESPQAHVSFTIMADIINSLRKDGFDCDGLIESGFAIDKKILK